MRSPDILRLVLLSTAAFAQYTFVTPDNWIDYTNSCEANCLTDVFNKQQCNLANACNSYHCLTLDYSCLCGTPSWLTTTSQCIGANCGAGAVHDAAGIVSTECKTAGVAMAVSEDKIVQVGLAAAPSSSPSSGPSGGGSGSGSGGALSTKLQVIIGVVTSIVGLVVAVVGVYFAWKQYKHSKAHTHHTESHSNLEAASSTTALAAVGVVPARGSVSEERQSQEGTARPLPSSQSVAAALRRVDS